MPYKSQRHKTRHQRQTRRAGHVRRVEIVLSADSERDRAISDFLDSLPGAAAEFIRQAVVEKMQREGHQPAPEPEAPVAQLEALYQDLADERRRASDQLEAMIAELSALRETVTPPEPPGDQYKAIQAELAELQTQNRKLRERLQESEDRALTLRRQLDDLQTRGTEAEPVEARPDTNPDAERQQALSAKLKKIHFGTLSAR